MYSIIQQVKYQKKKKSKLFLADCQEEEKGAPTWLRKSFLCPSLFRQRFFQIVADHWMLLHPLFAWDPNPEIRTHVHLMNTGHCAFSWLTWELLEPGIQIGD